MAEAHTHANWLAGQITKQTHILHVINTDYIIPSIMSSNLECFRRTMLLKIIFVWTYISSKVKQRTRNKPGLILHICCHFAKGPPQ